MANDPVMNIAGNVDPDMMGSHGGIGALYGRLKREQQYSRQFADDKRLMKRKAQLQGDLMTHGANINDWQQRREHGIDSDEELQALGGHAGAKIASEGKATMEHVVNPMQAAHTIMGPNGQLEARQGFNLSLPGGVRYGTNQYQARQPKKGSTAAATGPVAPENERPTHVVNPADTNPNAGRQFTLDSDVQGVYDLRRSPAGKQTKKAGNARAMEWGPLSKEDKATDALRTTPAQAQQDEIDLAPKPVKKAKANKVATEEAM